MSNWQFGTFTNRLHPDSDGLESDLIFPVDIDVSQKAGLLLPVSGNVDIEVFWGDGTSNVYNQTGIANTVTNFASASNPKHTYAETGTYVVATRGNVSNIKAITDNSLANNNPYITTFTSVGTGSRANAFDLSFENKENQILGLPDFLPSFIKKVKFANCTTLPASITKWNTSAVIDFSDCFKDANYTGNISNWNLYNAELSANMFAGSTNSTVNIKDWVVTDNKANGVNQLFSSTTGFQGDMSNWSFNNSTILYGLTSGSTDFKGNMSGWNVSAINNTTANNWKLFSGSTTAQPNLNNWTLSNATNIHGLFDGSNNVTVDINTWNGLQDYIITVAGRSGTNKGHLFANATLPTLTQPNITNYSELFAGVDNIVDSGGNGNLDTWDMSSVTNISGLFTGALDLDANISAWSSTLQTGIDMSRLADGANEGDGNDYLRLNLSDWDVSDSNCSKMFANTGSMRGNLYNWNFSTSTNATEMFANAEFTLANVDGWNMSNLTLNTNTTMFKDASNIRIKGLSNVTFPTNSNFFFKDANSIISEPLNNLSLTGATNINGFFKGVNVVSSDASANLDYLDISSVTSMDEMFANVGAMFGQWNNVTIPITTSITNMFQGSTLGAGANFKNWDLQGRADLDGVLANAGTGNAPLMTGWDVSDVTSLANSFVGSSSNIDISSWIVGSQDLSYMFQGVVRGHDSSSGSLNDWDMSGVTNLTGFSKNVTTQSALINSDLTWQLGNISLESFAEDTRYFKMNILQNDGAESVNISNVTSMKNMFKNADEMATPYTTVSGVFPNLTTMEGIYRDASFDNEFPDQHRLENIIAPNCTTMKDAFRKSSNATPTSNAIVNIANVTMSSLVDVSNVFHNCTIQNNGFTSISNTWVTGTLTNISNCFHATKSNSDIHLNGWDVSTISDFSVSFANCVLGGGNSFFGPKGNSTIDISDWNMNAASNCREMFRTTYSNIHVPETVTFGSGSIDLYETFLGVGNVAGQGGLLTSLAGWDWITNPSNLTTTRFARYSGMSDAHYNQTLIAWANRAHAKLAAGGSLPSVATDWNFTGNLRSNVVYSGSPYNTGFSARAYLTSAPVSYIFIDDGSQ